MFNVNKSGGTSDIPSDGCGRGGRPTGGGGPFGFADLNEVPEHMPERGDRASSEFDVERFEQNNSRHFLSIPGHFASGPLFGLSLANLQRQLGPRWSALAPEINAVASHVLSSHMEAGDAFVRLGRSRYLFGFARSDSAKDRACAIVAELAKKIAIENPSTEIELNELDLNDLIATIREQSHRLDVIANGEAVEGHDGAIANPASVAFSVSVGYRFVPVWDVASDCFSTYAIMPVGCSSAGADGFGHGIIGPDATSLQRATFDARTLESAAAFLRRAHERQLPVILTVNVDFASLATSKSREVVIRACRLIPVPLRSYTVIQVTNVALATAMSTLVERIGLLRPFARSITCEVTNAQGSLSRLGQLGLHGVGFRFGQTSGPSPLEGPDLIDTIGQAKAAKLKVAALSVPDLATANRLIGAGVGYLSGPFTAEAVGPQGSLCSTGNP